MERILDVCKELERARKQVGLPLKQQLLQLENSSKTACYSNSGTNLLLFSPRISRFLTGLLDCWTAGLLGIVRGLAHNKPYKVSSLTGLRECVARLVAEGEQFLQPHSRMPPSGSSSSRRPSRRSCPLNWATTSPTC